MTVTKGIVADYTDPGSGITLTNAWLEIRQINYIAEISCLVVVDVYASQAARNAGLSPVFMNVLPIVLSSNPDFSSYFSVTSMQQANHDIQSQGISYITSIYL